MKFRGRRYSPDGRRSEPFQTIPLVLGWDLMDNGSVCPEAPFGAFASYEIKVLANRRFIPAHAAGVAAGCFFR